MSESEPKPPQQKSKLEERSTDMEVVLFLVRHIDKPCEDLEGNNIRDFYIREAKNTLLTIKNVGAKKILEEAIRKYSV